MGAIGGWLARLSGLAPYALVIAAFSFLYVFVPNTRVKLKPAACGGLFAGVLWAGSGSVFTSFVVSLSRYEAIYSGFAIVLVAMLWLYLSWLILLLGAQLAFYLQNPDYLRLGQRTEVMSNGLRERLALSAMLLIARDFDKPGHGWRVESLAARIRIPRHLLEPVIGSLMSADLVTQTSEQRLMPARDPHGINACDILDAVRNADRDPHHAPGGDWNATVQEHPLARRERDSRGARDVLARRSGRPGHARGRGRRISGRRFPRSRRRTRSHRRTSRRGRRHTANRLTDRVAPLSASSSPTARAGTSAYWDGGRGSFLPLPPGRPKRVALFPHSVGRACHRILRSDTNTPLPSAASPFDPRPTCAGPPERGRNNPRPPSQMRSASAHARSTSARVAHHDALSVLDAAVRELSAPRRLRTRAQRSARLRARAEYSTTPAARGCATRRCAGRRDGWCSGAEVGELGLFLPRSGGPARVGHELRAGSSEWRARGVALRKLRWHARPTLSGRA